MSTTTRILLITALLSVCAPAFADGPGANRPRERSTTPAVDLASELKAIDAYNAGYACIQRAEHFESLGAASAVGAERNTALQESRTAYEDSLVKFHGAVKLDPSMHEAYTYLGYASRKLGRYDQSLENYAKALRITPDYPYAIEYQGQAFLGLNRIDEAKFNYLRLYALNQGQAHKLLRAIAAWAEANAGSAPADVDIGSLREWIAGREAEHDPNERAGSW